MDVLTREEREFVYYQLCARKSYFEEEMIEAASYKSTKRSIECNDALTTIKIVQDKLLNG